MVVLNYTGGEINAKIVYYGPGVSGKTTNLEYIHEKAPASAKGKMVSMKTQTDRTLFFDFLPLELGEINGYRTRFLLYTVPGQVYYNATRKLVLKGVDAIVFVADSSRGKLNENLESLKNLEQNLNEHGMSLDETPWVIQYNKRDLPDAMPVAELDAKLNPMRVPTFEAVATLGTGVYETLHGISTKVYGVLKDRLERDEAAGVATPEPAPVRPAERAAPVRPAAPAAPQRPLPVPELAAVAAAQRKPAPAAPAAAQDEIEREHEVDHAVDFALRESPLETGATRRPTASVPAKPRTPERTLAAKAPERAPMRASAPAEPAPAANRAADTDDLFEAIPRSEFDVELGRLPSLDEASAASDTARDAGPEEFVTDPMRHTPRREPAPAPAPAKSVLATPAPKPAPKPVAEAPLRSAVNIPIVEELHVPVYITRTQLERSSSVRIVLDLEIEDE
jgi:signal recognition particle receptor subunit beta